MRIALEIVDPGKQGAPAHGLPGLTAPSAVDPRLVGIMSKGKMAARVTLLGAHDYGMRYASKWAEHSPLAAISSGHGYAGTPAPKYTLAKIGVSAGELDGANIVNGAVRLRNLLWWLALCTVPWTRLGRPPLLKIVAGTLISYGYLTDFDPTVDEWMIDSDQAGSTGLPHSAAFSLTFLGEPRGLLTLEPATGLPSSQTVEGGGGGLGAIKVGLPKAGGR